MRVFIALELPSRTKDNLSRSVEQFKQMSLGGNFIPDCNYHVTLHFLGEVVESDLIYVQRAMDQIADIKAPTMSVSQYAILRASDIVCAKFNYSQELVNLHDTLGAKLEELNFDVEHRAYRPHVSLIRRYNFSLPFSEVTKNVDVFNKPFVATEVVLYKSTLTKDGAQYEELYRVSLANKNQ